MYSKRSEEIDNKLMVKPKFLLNDNGDFALSILNGPNHINMKQLRNAVRYIDSSLILKDYQKAPYFLTVVILLEKYPSTRDLEVSELAELSNVLAFTEHQYYENYIKFYDKEILNHIMYGENSFELNQAVNYVILSELIEDRTLDELSDFEIEATKSKFIDYILKNPKSITDYEEMNAKKFSKMKDF